MNNIKKVNEFFDDIYEPGTGNIPEEGEVFDDGIFEDIGGDLENMPEDERGDYLSKIIRWCEIQLKG
jgi:hypothetical protein